MKSLVKVMRAPALALLIAGSMAAPMSAQDDAALTEIKSYLTSEVDSLVAGATNYQTWAQGYFELAESYDFDYQAMWDAEAETLPTMIEDGRAIWIGEANLSYERAEGLVAGVPSLAEYDVWIDAGPSGEEDPNEARDWTFETADGRSFEKPGNIFHHITETTLWGTHPDFVGLEADLDGDGEIELGEALPDAYILQGGADVLLEASTELQGSVADWEPTLTDAFTALVVMIPTAQEYFGQWAESPFVLASGDVTQQSFVGTSRLVDIYGIFGGLQLTWENLAPMVAEENPELAEQITTDMTEMVSLVDDLYTQEQAGTRFTPEQADEYGQELQARGESVAGNITQGAALVGVDLQL